MFGQLKVDTRLSLKDSIIIVTLQNESEYEMLISSQRYISEINFLFIDIKGDTIQNNWFSYGHSIKDLRFNPKETKINRYFTWDKINFEVLDIIKVNHSIKYIYADTIFRKENQYFPNSSYREEVSFDIQKILDPCCEIVKKNDSK